MKLWTGIVIALIVQEFATVGGFLIAAQKSQISVWPIHLIWIVATTLDITVGFWAAKWLQSFAHPRWMERAKQRLERWLHHLGPRGESVAIALLAAVDYPWLNSFAASWLGISFKRTFLLTFIGDAIWYALEWLGVLGLSAIVPKLNDALIVIAVLGIAVTIIFGFVRRKLEAVKP
jgi:membrane protein YqaA with SNARE-associated domain